MQRTGDMLYRALIMPYATVERNITAISACGFKILPAQIVILPACPPHIQNASACRTVYLYNQ